MLGNDCGSRAVDDGDSAMNHKTALANETMWELLFGAGLMKRVNLPA